MKVGMLDVDAWSRGKVTFPNLPLMKLSAFHKQAGDTVSWYEPEGTERYDIVYLARVFSDEYTKDFTAPIRADRVVRGGSGYAITTENGKECYYKERDPSLPYEVDHIMPDYSLYGIEDTAYGFLTKGCPRGCDFCHVKGMQGQHTYTVARLTEFWSGQPNIKLLDPNITASLDYEMHMNDLIESRAYVDFTQGLDIRLLTPKKAELLMKVRYKRIHFAWDRPEEDLEGKFREISTVLKGQKRKTLRGKVSAYVLTNFNSTHEQDLHRIQVLRECSIQPYVMIYRKSTAPKETRQLQRWCNPFIFWKVPTFEEYRSENYLKVKKEDHHA